MKWLIYLAALLLTCPAVAATQYVNTDFSAPEQRSYGVVFGTPTVQSSVGPLQDALVFDAVSSYEQIEFSGPFSSRGLEVNYDIYTHNLRDSKYAFTVLFDTPEVRTMSFHGGLKGIDLFRPGSMTWAGPFYDDQVYHVRMMIDFNANTWTVSLDGQPIASTAFAASTVESIRFSMSPWYANSPTAPGVYVAIDNLSIAAIPEPSAWALLLMATLPLCLWQWRRQRHTV